MQLSLRVLRFDGLSKIPSLIFVLGLILITTPFVYASRGDRLRPFKECVQSCVEEKNCLFQPSPIPLHLRLLLWTCSSECDYTCQQAVTADRISRGQSIEQFHGKWPFRRLFGIQEPFSVLFSVLNGYAHLIGLRWLRHEIPNTYPMAKYYRLFAVFGMVCWFWSTVFHTRDFVFTEKMDYFGAGANVLYGLYYAPIRIFRLYKSNRKNLLSFWGYICIGAYILHVYYLQFVRWNYTYNMAANVVVGSISNILWSYYSVRYYSKVKRFWAAWPGLIVTWLVLAMSLELLDFPPIADSIDAHSLWHASTILPTVWWYRFLIRDARQDLEIGEGTERLKA